MEITLSVNRETCIRCGHCVRVCPAGIFTQADQKAEIGLRNIENCIKCGHCAAVCPTGTVIHGDFPPQKVHGIDPLMLPTPEQMMLLCKSRRSNRAFSKKPVPEEMFAMILEAANRAPTGSNMQLVEYTLVTDPEKLKQIIELTLEIFGETVKKMKNPILKPFIKMIMPSADLQMRRLERLQKEYDKGNDPILRGATSLLFIHTPESNRTGMQDANLAYQNGSLMAESLGVSQFYTGYVCIAIARDKKDRIAELMNIKGKICAGMALGMPGLRYPNYIDRKEVKVTRF